MMETPNPPQTSAPDLPERSQVWLNPPTRKNLRKVLAIGFTLVIVLLLSAGYVSFSGLESIERSTAGLQQEQTGTSRIIAEIQGEQAALSAIFYKLSGDPENIDRESILQELNEADQNLSRLTEEPPGSVDEQLWRQMAVSSREFSNEARRLLDSDTGSSYLSADLFHRHDQIISIASRLVAAQSNRAREAQEQILRQLDQLRRRSGILMGACLMLALLCAAITVRMTTQLLRRMEEQSQQMHQVSWHLLQSQEGAARRFSHELHDELGQSLAALKANLSTLVANSPAEEARLADCRVLVDDSVRNVRELSHLLRPTILDDFGLDPGLRWLAERFAQRTGIQVDYDSSYSGRLPDATETHLFRIAQEALTNISKHSKAKLVQMRLEASPDEVRLLIRDNGVGMNAGARPVGDGLGLIGMQARSQSMGGAMELRTAQGAGLEISVRVPRTEQRAERVEVRVGGTPEEWHEGKENTRIAG